MYSRTDICVGTSGPMKIDTLSCVPEIFRPQAGLPPCRIANEPLNLPIKFSIVGRTSQAIHFLSLSTYSYRYKNVVRLFARAPEFRGICRRRLWKKRQSAYYFSRTESCARWHCKYKTI